jgi:hypothetical protein
MTYEFDEDARNEAAEHSATADVIEQLRELCRAMASRLGAGGARGHTVDFVPAAWANVVSLPASIPQTGQISRGDVLDIGNRVRQGTSPATELFVASFVWGLGIHRPRSKSAARYSRRRAASASRTRLYGCLSSHPRLSAAAKFGALIPEILTIRAYHLGHGSVWRCAR